MYMPPKLPSLSLSILATPCKFLLRSVPLSPFSSPSPHDWFWSVRSAADLKTDSLDYAIMTLAAVQYHVVLAARGNVAKY